MRPGEILGFSGLVGAGRTELFEALFGLRKGAGEIRLHDVPQHWGDGRAAMRAGAVYLTEDRKGKGLCQPLRLRGIALLVGRQKKVLFADQVVLTLVVALPVFKVIKLDLVGLLLIDESLVVQVVLEGVDLCQFVLQKPTIAETRLGRLPRVR